MPLNTNDTPAVYIYVIAYSPTTYPVYRNQESIRALNLSELPRGMREAAASYGRLYP